MSSPGGRGEGSGSDLPAQLRVDVRTTLLTLPTAAPEAWQELTDDKSQGVQDIAHAEYEPIIRMLKDATRPSRRKAN
jgi:hypothetical protein